MDKDAIIEKCFFESAGLGNINETLPDGKQFDSTITYDNVKQWTQPNILKQKTLQRL